MYRKLFTLFTCASLIGIGLPVGDSLQAQEAAPSLAVLPLQGNNVYGERTRMLGHRLRKLLARKYGLPQVDYALVDSSNVFDCQNVQCAVEKGRLLHVDQVIYGQIRNQKNSYRLHLTLVDTQTGKKIHEVSESCNYCDFTQVLKSLAPTLLDSMPLTKGESAASNGSQLVDWENHVGNGLTFDYPAEVEMKEKVYSHRNGNYLYSLKLKNQSPFTVTILVFKKPDSALAETLNSLKDLYREMYSLDESQKIKFSLGNKQIEGIPYLSKATSDSSQSKGLLMIFDGTVNVYQVELRIPASIDAESERVIREFFKNFLKTLYVS